MELKTIIVATDFSAEAEPAVAHALNIARRHDSKITLIHVCPVIEPPQEITAVSEWNEYMRQQLDSNRQRLEELRSSISGQGVEVSHMVVDDVPALGINRSAAELGADLVVVGTRGHTGVKHFLLGSVAERVIRGSGTNVLVARPGADKPIGGYQSILVATDFDESTDRTVSLATSLVAKDGLIDVRHFWHIPAFGPIPDPEILGKEQQEGATERGKALLSRYAGDTYKIKFVAKQGYAKHSIQQLLEKGTYDLVILGSHGRRGIGRWLLGSVAESTARHAPCSVLIVKAKSVAEPLV